MAEIDLPAGNTGGEQHLAKFLATLTQLVDVLGHVGPGGGRDSSAASSPDDSSNKALVGATRKLFQDVANAFRPLKSVLAGFSKLQATPQPTAAPPAAPSVFSESPPPPAPAEAPNIQNPKYDKYFKTDPFDSMRASSTPKASITPAAPSAPPAAPASTPAAPAPKSPPAATAKTLQNASFKVGNALLQGKFMFPPAFSVKANQVTVQGKQSASTAPPAPPAPGSSAPKSPTAPAPPAAPTPQSLQSAVIHIASATIHANTAPAPATAPASAPAASSPASSPGGGGNKFASLFGALTRGMQEAARNLATGALEAGKKMASLVGSGVAAPVKAAHRVVGNVGEKLTMAFNDPIGAIQSFGRLMIGFVEVINPAAVLHFNKAIKDITAIIGLVLAPAMTILTEVAREFGNLMVPIAKQIAPIFTELARTIGDLLIAQVRTFATYLQVLMPIIKSLMIIFGGLARIATAINEGFMVFLSGFLGSFNGLDDAVRQVVDGIVDFVKTMVRYTLVAVAMVAKLFGATDFIEKMRKAAAGKGPEKEDSTGLANPTNANFAAAESFGKSIATASFTATSAATAPKKTDDFLEDISKDMEKIADMDVKQTIIDAIEASAPAIARAIAGGAKETIKAAGNAAYEYNPLKGIGEWLGNKVASGLGYEVH